MTSHRTCCCCCCRLARPINSAFYLACRRLLSRYCRRRLGDWCHNCGSSSLCVIGQYTERKFADTIGTVLIRWAGHFQCWNINIYIFFSNKIYGSNFIKQHSETYGLKLSKCWLQFKNIFIVSFIITFGTLSFHIGGTVRICPGYAFLLAYCSS